jgi:hypothetical protein
VGDEIGGVVVAGFSGRVGWGGACGWFGCGSMGSGWDRGRWDGAFRASPLTPNKLILRSF